ncbi:SAF domain-containing protein [Aeromicrobium marinum]|uniref:SAF domain-containing protein n=1 Tax=Aeromicrobium marinum TaxID=219314 RepID=UPI000682E430|nr:SAF domain-containing protein [Aeromicrobium marinum]
MATDTTRVASTTEQDRQRDRAARGIRSRERAAGGADRPSPPRRRRPALAALAVLLIVGGAALAGLLALRLDSREPVLVLNQDVSAGTEITADLLTTADVASSPLMLVRENQVDQVLGTYARTGLSEGQLLDTSMLTREEPVSAGDVRVGFTLTPGRVPPDLRSGDEVRLVRLGDGTQPAEALAVGLVLSASSPTDGGGGLGGDIASDGFGTVLVAEGASDAVVDAAGRDLLGVTVVRRGVAIDDADLRVLGAPS